MDVFFAVLFFAFSTTITPGPNNIMMLSSGVNYGVKASLPHFFGICVGFPLMVLLIGLGFGVVFERFPLLHLWIKVIGVLYLLWLAWKIGSATPSSIGGSDAKPLSFLQAALFQWVNGKAWIMASGAVAAFTTVSGHAWWDVTQITTAFLVVSFPCVGLWLCFGALLRSVLDQPLYQRIFNWAMALLLVLSVAPVLAELYTQWIL
ncbi:LysE family translocator [Rheinheimera mesophila]|uniref:LysE family translocator n=1 Tax=Rheinheimera mesophila TaxID=1547515 RepID=A0A3P3QR19_9GAMM|nr:LysE family translocator [Rheinheimera mesophila]KKL02875.1 lysine transporter LysE [Rheinheimera mesophila]RRJ22890.1 LysE family translocator [Rheinheimera mesophila]